MIPQLVVTQATTGANTGLLDPVTTLGRLETVLSAGVPLVRAAQGSGVRADLIETMLRSDFRDKIGQGYERPGRDNEEVKALRCLGTWLDEWEAKRREESRTQIATPTRTLIEGIASRALRKKTLVSLIGSYGIGKSSTLEWFALANPMTRAAPGAIYVPFTKDDKGPAAIYEKINQAARLGQASSARGRSLGTRVRDAMRPGDLILCDNANYLLQTGSINVLADIHDLTPASLIVAANPVYAHLTKTADDDVDAFFNRAETVRIDHSTDGDVDAVLLARGLAGEALRSDAIKIGTRPGREGGLRALFKVIDRAEERAAHIGRVLDAKVFRQAARELGLL